LKEFVLIISVLLLKSFAAYSDSPYSSIVYRILKKKASYFGLKNKKISEKK